MTAKRKGAARPARNKTRSRSAVTRRSKRAGKRRDAEPPTAAPAWAATPLSTGETLGDAAAARPVLLVFLRHSG